MTTKPRHGLDPAERFPELAHYWSEQDLERWRLKGECLCGCGEITSLLHGRGPGHTYFKNGHISPFKKRHGLKASNPGPKTSKFMASLREKNRNETIDATFIVSLVEDYCYENKISSLWKFAKITGFEHSVLYEITSGRRKRMTKKSAARLLSLIGEPIPKELQRNGKTPA